MNRLREMSETEIYTEAPSADFAHCLPGIPVGILEVLLEDAGMATNGERIVSVEVDTEEFGYWRLRVKRRDSPDAEIWRVTGDYKTGHVTCEGPPLGRPRRATRL